MNYYSPYGYLRGKYFHKIMDKQRIFSLIFCGYL